ncbi:MAG TPA: hypothetical protein VMG98_04170 [Verrucomicrobiae bacterium]|nr:hypothetical protein [Verrucomicrobiae bacterium]HTZ56029.1 hypothetical protein [Candidatus Acidoferrum sp.]
MPWIGGKSRPKSSPEPVSRNGPHVAPATQELIAKFLVGHERVELRNGHPQLHFIGMSHNHIDGSVDYVVRSRVHGIDNKMHRFDSQIRIYASGHLKLIR